MDGTGDGAVMRCVLMIMYDRIMDVDRIWVCTGVVDDSVVMGRVEWSGVDWNGMELRGVEWSGLGVSHTKPYKDGSVPDEFKLS